MHRQSRKELDSIKQALDGVIRELNAISTGVRDHFKGIGSEQCADCIDHVTSTYRRARRQLDQINTSKVTKEFASRNKE